MPIESIEKEVVTLFRDAVRKELSERARKGGRSKSKAKIAALNRNRKLRGKAK